MLNLGTVRPGSTIRIPFSTFKGSDGSSLTMTNYAAADILVYKDGSTTERASTSGYTATTDFDSKTGKHVAIIDLADNTTAGFWNAGSEYLVAIDAVTVDAVTTGGWIARFSIGYPEAILNTTIASLSSQTSFTLTNGPAEDNALNGMWAVIHDIASAVQLAKVLISAYTGSTKTVTLVAGATFTVAAGDNISVVDLAPLQPTTAGRTLDVSSGGEAGVDWANVGSPTTSLALTGTTIATTQKVDIETIKTNPVVNAGTVTFPTTATLASTTNITAGTITTTTNLTNLPAITTDWLTGTGVAASAVTKIQNGLSTLTQTQVTGGAYNIQSASCVLGDARIANLDAAVSSRGTSTLTQTQVTGGAYSLNSSSFAFNSAMDFTTAQKAATLARVTLTDTVTTYTGNTPQTGDAYAVVNSGTFGNAVIKGYVDDIGTAGAGLTAIPWNAAWDAEVQSEVQDAIEANNLDHLVKVAVDTDFPTTVHLNSVIGYLADNGTTASFDRTTDALEAIRDRGDAAWTTGAGTSTLTAGDVSAAVWDAATASYGNAGTYGLLVETNLDAAITSRMATYTQPTGFLAATFPTTLASTTNITSASGVALAANQHVIVDSGTVTTLTNLPAITTDWLSAAGVSAEAVTKIQNGLSTYAGGDTAGTTTLLSRVTATRAGYWDNLSGGAVALASGVTVTTNNDKTGYSLTVTPPTAAQIDTLLSSTHGAGSWATATGFATPTNVTDAATAVIDWGDDHWTTATGFAVAGDAMTLTSGERDSVADALLGLANGIETGVTVKQALRAIAAGIAGILEGAGGVGTGTVTVDAINNEGTTRLTVTTDVNGNRTAITYNL